MSNEEILQETAQTESAPKEGLMKKIMGSNLLVFLPAAVAVVAILLGYFSLCFGYIINLISGLPFKYMIQGMITAFTGSTGTYIVALLLPAAVIVAKKLQKPMLTKILMFVSLGFIGIQLLSAFVCLILSFIPSGTVIVSALQGFFGFFSGSNILSSLVYMVKNLFSGSNILMVLGWLVRNGIRFLAEFLFLAKNVLCLLLLFKYSKEN